MDEPNSFTPLGFYWNESTELPTGGKQNKRETDDVAHYLAGDKTKFIRRATSLPCLGTQQVHAPLDQKKVMISTVILRTPASRRS